MPKLNKPKIPIASLSAKAAIISIGQLSNSLSHLAVAIILSYFLSKELYGTYRQVWLIYHFITPILILGLPMSINFFMPKLKTGEQKSLNIQTLVMLSAMGFFFSLLLFTGAPVISGIFKNNLLIEPLKIFSFVPLLTFPTLYYQNLFVCLDKPFWVAKISLLMAAGYFLSIALPALLGYNINHMFISFNVYSLIQLITVLTMIFKPFRHYKWQWDPMLVKKQLHYAVPIGLTALAGIFSKQLDKLFISSFLSVVDFATYVNGAFEIPFIGIITGSVTAVLMPEFVKMLEKNDTNKMIQTWHASIRKVAIIIFPLMCFLLVLAPEVMTLLFSGKYADSSTIFRIYLLALPLRIANFGMILLSLGLPGVIFKYTLYSLILNLIMNYVLIIQLGMIGPAIATVLMTYTIAFLQARRIIAELNFTFKRIFPWGTLRNLLIISIVSCLPIVLTANLSPIQNRIFIVVSSGFFYGASFLILGSVFKLLSPADLNFIKSIFAR